MKVALPFVLVCVSCCLVSAGVKKEKLTKSQIAENERLEAKALSKYDELPDEYKKQAIDLWKDRYADAQKIPQPKKGVAYNPSYDPKAVRDKNVARVLENDPVIGQSIFSTSSTTGKRELKKNNWGVLSVTVTGRGVYVSHVISPTKSLCETDDIRFVVEGVDTSDMVDDKMAEFPGFYIVDGTTMYDGAKVYLVKPIKKQTAPGK